jgi:hypothetical protein
MQGIDIGAEPKTALPARDADGYDRCHPFEVLIK